MNETSPALGRAIREVILNNQEDELRGLALVFNLISTSRPEVGILFACASSKSITGLHVVKHNGINNN